MAVSWYLMNQPPIYNGGFEGEEFHAYATDGFQEVLDTTMLCDHVEFITSDFSKIVKGQAIVQSVTPDTQLKAEDRQILVPIGTLQGYAYIRFEGVMWLIASEPTNNKFYEKAALKVCNNCLRWQDPETKEIHSYWFWCEDTTRYSNGIHDGRIIIKYDKQYSVMLPLDDDTRKLHNGMRFMLEMSDDMPLVYKLTKFDGVTGNNKTAKILKISLTQTVYDETTDNVELMIADYNIDTSVSHDENYECRILYTNDSIRLSSFGRFSVEFPSDSNLIPGVDYFWEVSSDEFDVSQLELTPVDGDVKVKVGNYPELAEKHFDLNITNSTGTVLASIDITIESLW